MNGRFLLDTNIDIALFAEDTSVPSRFISKGSEVQGSGLVKVNKRKANLNL